ncbi:hypothetical protein P9112_001036 [Eukaryota sp. TZLM1-RC]
MSSSLVDLVSFVDPNTNNSQVLRLAVRELASYSNTDTCYDIVKIGALPKLCRLLSLDDPIVVHSAYNILVNLSAEEDLLSHIISEGIITRIMERIMNDKSYPFLQIALMLLSNLSLSEDGCDALMASNGSFIIKLIVEMSRPFDEGNDKAAFVAPILGNVSRLKSFKELVTLKQPSLFSHILDQLSSCSIRRRGGAACAVRNILFDESLHLTLLTDANDTLWKSLERVIVNDPVKEDGHILLMVIESLFLLCSSEKGMELLRGFNLGKLIEGLIEQLQPIKDQNEDFSSCINTCNSILNRLDDFDVQDVEVINKDAIPQVEELDDKMQDLFELD